MLVVRFTITGKPQPLQRARLGNGHFYTPEESVKYQEKVRRCAVFAGCPVFAPGCAVELAIYLPDRRRRDRDNIEKGIMDALQGNAKLMRRPIAWVDDHDVGPILKVWAVDRERPRVEVVIRGEVAVPAHDVVITTVTSPWRRR